MFYFEEINFQSAFVTVTLCDSPFKSIQIKVNLKKYFLDYFPIGFPK